MRMLALTCIPIIGLTGCAGSMPAENRVLVSSYERSEHSTPSQGMQREAAPDKTSGDGGAPW